MIAGHAASSLGAARQQPAATSPRSPGGILHSPPLPLAYWVNRMSAVMARLQMDPEGHHDDADTPAAGRDRAGDGRTDDLRPARAHRRGGGRHPGLLRRVRRRLADADL